MTIDGYEVFLTWNQYHELIDRAGSEMKETWISKMNSKSVRRAIKRRNEILEKHLLIIAKERPREFEEEWLKFNLTGLEAQENVWNLLNDFTQSSHNYWLSDLRPFGDQLVSSYEGEDFGCYPLGKEFALIFRIPEVKTWFKKIEAERKIEFHINTESVTKLEGRFSDYFTVSFQDFKMVFGANISIRPLEE